MTSVFKTNPVVLFGHDLAKPIGVSLTPSGEFGLQVKRFDNGLNGLYHTTRFNRQTELGDASYISYRDGFLRGWSLSFRLRSRPTAVPEAVARVLWSSAKGARFLPDALVLEYSAVPIPDNAACLTDVRWKALRLPDRVTAHARTILTRGYAR